MFLRYGNLLSKPFLTICKAETSIFGFMLVND